MCIHIMLYLLLLIMLSFLFCFISRIWNETWLSSFFYKPCNYELFVKQSLNMEMAIVMARVKHFGLIFFFFIHVI